MQMLRRWILYVFRRDRQRLSLVLSRFKSVEGRSKLKRPQRPSQVPPQSNAPIDDDSDY